MKINLKGSEISIPEYVGFAKHINDKTKKYNLSFYETVSYKSNYAKGPRQTLHESFSFVYDNEQDLDEDYKYVIQQISTHRKNRRANNAMR